ncbi:phage tail fiber protein [Acinetobacter baumannii]|uniref:phage tail fiber protein n=1 Tax=Acinetobacter baumannii TaxID=470 RepID=UPI00215E1460|nr:phage tail protein [Acinetobacter baumannii]
MANLVFKYSWDHRPFPYNSAQGKRQFMLPFASGIPNLTPHWSQVGGLGTAATANVGNTNATDVIPTNPENILDFMTLASRRAGFFQGRGSGASNFPTAEPNMAYSVIIGGFRSTPAGFCIFSNASTNPRIVAYSIVNNGGTNILKECKLYTSANTSVDANGFIKAASPIVKLFANKVELNEDAKQQCITFERLGVGDYLVKGSLGFAQEGWYIEIPKDANGNAVVAVLYDTLENGDISIKTYKRKFDFELAAVIADLESPLDIPEGRWIDIRLHEEPEPEPEEPLSETPVDFQPTNLSQAVAAAMNGVEPPEISETDETL